MRPETLDGPLTVQEYEALPEEDGIRVELVRGRLVREPGPGFSHGSVSTRIVVLLERHVSSTGGGAVLVNSRFTLSRDPATVRVPDLSFVRGERLPEDPDFPGALEGAPDLAVEILSPSNRASEIQERIADYLAAGARLCWIVDPATHTVTVYSIRHTVHRLGRDDLLDGGEVLPGFEVSVAELFPGRGPP